ncbi:MAG: S-methyl-5'-thioadenosine phosphorylase [Bacteroidales bacterium]|nr:S-methyl-5'-thioadenosine phosphorylase [Bacteroidales bacterium]
MKNKNLIGIIGGTGLEKSNILENVTTKNISTSFGEPSSPILMGEICGKSVAIVSRHGLEHTITPTHVNYRANIMALKSLGCEKIIATTACGSLREEVAPGHFVIPDQFIDFTKRRIQTFYEEFEPNNMVHCPMAEPYNNELRQALLNAAKLNNAPVHDKGTLITIEGPRFSSRAESKMFRLWGADLINMTTATETALANEAGLKYAIIAVATDYDCWKEDENPVSLEMILANFKKSVDVMQKTLVDAIKSI